MSEKFFCVSFLNDSNFVSGSNRIKSMSGGVFDSLNNLNALYLSSNDCIDQSFFSPLQIETVNKKLSENCENEDFYKAQIFKASMISIFLFLLILIGVIVIVMKTKRTIFWKQKQEISRNLS